METAKTFEVARIDLNKARERYQKLSNHFERFCAEAQRLEDRESQIEGISVTRDGAGLTLGFLDRRIRVSFRFNRLEGKGELHVEDLSVRDREGWGPVTIGRVAFTASGETAISGGYGNKLINLEQPADCLTFALRFLDSALDKNPWVES
jgi:hypothetical protein